MSLFSYKARYWIGSILKFAVIGLLFYLFFIGMDGEMVYRGY